MGTLRKYTNRIFEHDGLVVVFAGFKRSYEYSLAHIEHGRLVPDAPSPSVFSNWSLLSLLDQRFETAPDFGEEVLVAAQKTPVHNLLKKFNADLRFLCTVAPIYGNEPGWVPLAKNKYGSPVSGAIVNNRKLKILIFPKVTNQVSFLCELFNSVLPELVPHLFPEHVGAKWVEDSQYELTNIVALKGRILEVEASARNETESLTQAIAAERAKMSFQYDLLRETGEKLVVAVKTSLAAMGFKSVVDSDELIQPGGRRREDLQIHDRSPVLLVEIKGIGGLPPEHDAIQVGKYIAPRMKEWNRTDVAGISIVNHQRNLPGLQRDPEPFTNDVITNALDQGFGLLTAWDLFRLVRNFLQHHWKPDDVQPLFYAPGRIDAVPTHYELVGQVEHYWERVGAVGVRISDASLTRGDRIAFQLPIDYFEQEAASIEVERKPVSEAAAGMLAGVKTNLLKGDARKGVRVFRIRR